MHIKKPYILIVALILGFFISLQTKSYENVNNEFLRDMESNIFQEIKILKDKNENLRREVGDLENTLEQFSDQNMSIQAIEDQIKRFTKLSGRAPVFGPGVIVTFEGDISTPWLVDLVNAFFGVGAEAISVNGIRLVNRTIGFDTLPRGQILLNGSVLSAPYVFSVIGETSNIVRMTELPGGIFSRMKNSIPNLQVELTSKDFIQMN
jgi:uncharacterized protein YlxW (UPF0749 family)